MCAELVEYLMIDNSDASSNYQAMSRNLLVLRSVNGLAL